MTTRVLLLEDHVSFRDALDVVMAVQDDLEVVAHVGRADEAGPTAARTAPDVAVVDLDLPGGSGVDAIAAIRAQSHGTACVVLTGLHDNVELGRAIEAGAAAILHKTTDMHEVLDVIRRVVDGATVLPVDVTTKALRALARERDQGWYGRVLHESLTGRELQVLERLADGAGNQEIAVELEIAPDTVQTHVRNLLGKMAAGSRLEAVIKGMRHGLVPPPR